VGDLDAAGGGALKVEGYILNGAWLNVCMVRVRG
jgi:hypothetical protein